MHTANALQSMRAVTNHYKVSDDLGVPQTWKTGALHRPDVRSILQLRPGRRGRVSAHGESAVSGEAPSNRNTPLLLSPTPVRHHQGRRLAARDPDYGCEISENSSLQPHALPQPRLLCSLLRLSQEQAVESPRVCCNPRKCGSQFFFPRYPLPTPWATRRARE
jgi:hypothetical protein